MNTIYSLTIKFLEQVFSGKSFQKRLEELKRDLKNEKYDSAKKNCEIISSEIGIESLPAEYKESFSAEMIFITGICEYMTGNFAAAVNLFSKCLKSDNFCHISRLMIISIEEKHSNYIDALSHIENGRETLKNYYYFNLLEIKTAFAVEKYDDAIIWAQKIINEINSRKERLLILFPQVKTMAADSYLINSILESIFSIQFFLYELLFTAAEANFCRDNYETAFEYYNEAESAAERQILKIECNYKMAACKIRLTEAVTAQKILETVITHSQNYKPAVKFYHLALLDLANLYEYSSGEIGLCIKTLINYAEECPDDNAACYRLGKLLYDTGRFNEALLYLNKIPCEFYSNAPECTYYCGMCYFEIGMNSISNDCFAKFINLCETENINYLDELIFKSRLAIIQNLFYLQKHDEAMTLLNSINQTSLAPSDYLQCQQLAGFIKTYKKSAEFLFVSPETVNGDPNTPKKSDTNFNVKIFKGFIYVGEEKFSEIGRIRQKFSHSIDNIILIINNETNFDTIKEFVAEFKSNPIFCDFKFGNKLYNNFFINLKKNPFNYSKIEKETAPFVLIARLLSTINLNEMPDILKFASTGEYVPESLELINKNSMLLFYRMFKTQKSAFDLILNYCSETVISSNMSAGDEDYKEIWPFMINFKNINFQCISGQSRDRFIVNGSDDIFIFNFLRQLKNQIDGNETVHILTEPSKLKPVEKMLSFILKKLEYSDSAIKSFSNISDMICLKKVNKLLAGSNDNPDYARNALLLILSIRAGFDNYHKISMILNEEIINKIKFTQIDCFCSNCNDFNNCAMSTLINSYNTCGSKFHISSYDNFFTTISLNFNIKKINETDNLIIFDLPQFYYNAVNFYSGSIKVKDLKDELRSISLSNAELIETTAKFLLALENFENLMPDYLKIYNDNGKIRKFLKKAVAFIAVLEEKFTINVIKEEFEELFKLKLISQAYAGEAMAKTLDSFLIKNKNSNEIEYKFYNKNFKHEIFLNRQTRRAYIINPEKPRNYFENKFEELVKFFKRIDISDDYQLASGKTGAALIQKENSAEYQNIITNFQRNQKRVGYFTTGLDYWPQFNKKFHDFSNGNLCENEILKMTINSPTEIEPILPELDCVVINFHSAEKERITSFLAILKNVIIKYSVDVFWIVISDYLYNNIFSKNSKEFEEFKNFKAYPNALEYISAFKEKTENVELFEKSASTAQYEDLKDLKSRENLPEKKEFIFNNAWLKHFNKITAKLAELAISEAVFRLPAPQLNIFEFIISILCETLTEKNYRKNVVIYAADDFMAEKINETLIKANLIKPGGMPQAKQERNLTVITAFSNLESSGISGKKIIRSSENILICAGINTLNFNSLAFDALKYEAWQKTISTFNSNLIIWPEKNYLNLKLKSAESSINSAIKGYAEKKQDNRCISTVNISELKEAVKIVLQDSSAAADSKSIIYGENSDIAIFGEIMDSEFKEYKEVAGKIKKIAINSNDFDVSINNEKNNEDYNEITAYFIKSFKSQYDTDYAAAILKDKLSENINRIIILNLPAAERSKKSWISFQDVQYYDILFKEKAGCSLYLTKKDIAMLSPVSAFSKSVAMRCLAVLSYCSKIKITDYNLLNQKTELNLDARIDNIKLLELKEAGIIETDKNINNSELHEHKILELINSKKISVKNEYKFIDTLAQWNIKPVNVKIKLKLKFEDGSKILTHSAKLRKKLMQFLCDIKEYNEGKWVTLPFFDANSLSKNDYYYARELCPLIWFEICRMHTLSDGTPAIKRLHMQGYIDSKMEKLENYLRELFDFLYAINSDSNLNEQIFTINELTEKIISLRTAYEKLKKGEYGPSYLLRLLKLMNFYGLIELKAAGITPETKDVIAVDVHGDYSNIEYKDFIEAYKALFKIEYENNTTEVN